LVEKGYFMATKPKGAYEQKLPRGATQQKATQTAIDDMKTCPYCKEQVRKEAIKCRYCQSMLLPPQLPELKQSDNDRVTYVLDQGLVRFGKFAGGVLAIFLIVGGYLFGFKLEAGLERVQTVQEKFTKAQADLAKTQAEFAKAQADLAKTQEEFTKAQADLARTQSEVTKAQTDLARTQAEVGDARRKVADLSKDVETAASSIQERARTVLASSEVLLVGPGPSSSGLVEAKILTVFRSVLTPDQYSALEKAIRSPSGLQRQVYSAENDSSLPGKLLRQEGQPATGDSVANQVYDNIGIVHEFFRAAFGRDITLDTGGQIIATVHFLQNYNNAFWDGRQIVIGDGDGQAFNSGGFGSLGSVVTQLAHSVIERTARLEYRGQSGALNTHFADVFAVLAEQWKQQESADQATWLIGTGLLAPGTNAAALRSMKAPGTAYDSPVLGKDSQPAHMKEFVSLPLTADGDYGGVHINSGIPNRAFYEVAKLIGGNAWERPGKIWYSSLLKSGRSTNFNEFAQTTFDVAGDLYGAGKEEQEAVRKGWEVVGITVGKR
jgi:Zn-dependent metalloprotease